MPRKVGNIDIKEYSAGDLKHRIVLQEREITAPVFGSASFTEEYQPGVEVWAGVKTVNLHGSGRRFFSNVNPEEEQPTHEFIIRYRNSVTSETRITWKGKYYKILSVQDPNEDGQYLELSSRILGNTDKQANN